MYVHLNQYVSIYLSARGLFNAVFVVVILAAKIVLLQLLAFMLILERILHVPSVALSKDVLPQSQTLLSEITLAVCWSRKVFQYLPNLHSSGPTSFSLGQFCCLFHQAKAHILSGPNIKFLLILGRNKLTSLSLFVHIPLLLISNKHFTD
jgi:hypothetical protein